MTGWFASWLGWKAKPKRRSASPSHPRRAQLSLEPLEDRLVPSNTTMLNANLHNLTGVVFNNTQPVGPTVDISRRAGNEFNPAVGIDPTHPSHLFAVANWDNGAASDGSGATGLFAAFSSDGGAHWTARALAAGGDGLPVAADGYFVGFAPSVSWDAYGNLYLAYQDQAGIAGHADLALSTDGGQSFRLLSSFGSAGGFEPKVATGAGTVWVAFRGDEGGFHRAALEASGARVTGLGQVGAFSTPEQATGPFILDDLAVGPSGQVMITYHSDYVAGPLEQHSVNLYTALDPDGLGPAGFNPPRLATVSNVDVVHPVLQSSQHATVNPAPGLAWDLSSGPHHGRLYLVYTDASTPYDPATNIYVRYSDDSGNTWSGPIQVNDDTSGNSHFLPRIAVDPVTGWVAVSWYDARNAANNDSAEVYATVSVDPHGLSFLPNVQVAGAPSYPLHVDTFLQYYTSFGGNTGLAFYNGTFYPAWADNSWSLSGNPDLAGFDIATAAVTAPWVPGPPVRGAPPELIDPLALELAHWLYVQLHTPDPVPPWVEQPGVLTGQTAASVSQTAALAPASGAKAGLGVVSQGAAKVSAGLATQLADPLQSLPILGGF
jgi:hypothetical protein